MQCLIHVCAITANCCNWFVKGVSLQRQGILKGKFMQFQRFENYNDPSSLTLRGRTYENRTEMMCLNMLMQCIFLFFKERDNKKEYIKPFDRRAYEIAENNVDTLCRYKLGIVLFLPCLAFLFCFLFKQLNISRN